MNFRDEYGDYSAQEAVDAILVILKQNGVEIDEKSFTWTLVGALFDKGVVPRQEFERIYFLLKSQMKEREKVFRKEYLGLEV